MPHPTTNDYLDEYDRELDEIVAACDGDVRSALRALLLVNEQLERILNCLNAEQSSTCRGIDGRRCTKPQMGSGET
ncbi:hypothetical protein ACVI1K_007491 [Bradyrhizobium sp. USDA 4508]